VKIEDPAKYGMGEPYQLKVNHTHSEPVYMLSVFHQLHCLVCPLPPIAFLLPLANETPS
jgi:hypothetical protein